jgi:Protein of unknown function (DUF4244)
MGKDIAVVAGGDLVVPAIDGMAEQADPEKAVGPGQSAEAGLDPRGHRGMVSAEWAVGIVAAVAIAGVLLAVVTSGEVQDALLKFLLWVIKGFISVVD